MPAGPHVTRATPETGPSSLKWKLAAAAVVLTIVGLGAARSYLPSRTTPGPTTRVEGPDGAAAILLGTPKGPRAKGTGSLSLVTQPDGARVLVDGKAAGVTPVTLDALSAGNHTITFVTEAGASVKKTVRIEAGKTATLDVPIYSGWIAVFAPITLEISEKGQGIGTTEQGRLMLSPGRHELTFTNREFAYRSVQSVDIEPGAERTLTVQPIGELNLNAVPWAEVWIDGQKVGETPLANFKVPLGTHEIAFRNAQFGERRVTSTVTAASPATAAVDFTKPPQP
jgi:hypothetical protein